ncbi:MAG: bifunctional riboflavin kinase/FAD synthetase [Clostridia bacterium]|nr:bifunctional riboflavin kinase/FAD synthetase [Clostridia bacterium]
MQVYTSENFGTLSLSGTAIALGGFDAIHMGHQAIIRNVVAYAKQEGLTSVVYLFRNQPREVVTGEALPSVYSFEKRLEILEELGVDVVVAAWFTPQFSQISPEEFVEEILKKQLDARYLAAGFHYRFGKKGAGDMTLLKKLCKPLDIAVYEQAEVQVDGETVSSTRIRELLQKGDLAMAERCLGRPFSMSGEVVSGNQVGRTMGFPTANMVCPKGLVVPKFGVYLTQTEVDGRWYPSITNVGARPTITDQMPWIETHLLDFQGDLYGKQIQVAFLSYLREITKFPSLDALKEQLFRDKLAAKEYFGK